MSLQTIDWNCASEDRPRPLLEPRWYVLLTEPRREMVAFGNITRAAKAAHIDVDLYCPRFMERKVRRGVLRERMVPLLPTYLLAKLSATFARWDLIERCFGIRPPVVISIDFYGARIPVSVPEWEMKVIMQTEAKWQKKPAMRVDALKVGQEVQIIDGPFAWFNATIEGLDKLDTQGRVAVATSIFGRLVPMEIDCHQIEALNQAKSKSGGRRACWRRGERKRS